MSSLQLLEDGSPESSQVAEIARRLAAITWFLPLSHGPRDPSQRLLAAVTRHGQLLRQAATPATARVLPPAVGREALRTEALSLDRVEWERELRMCFAKLQETLVQSKRAAGLGLFIESGEALLLRAQVLPISQDVLWDRLQGVGTDPQLTNAQVRRLVDRILWESGMMIAWEMVADIMGENPFKPLLDIWEEGLYFLDFSADQAALLWAPL